MIHLQVEAAHGLENNILLRALEGTGMTIKDHAIHTEVRMLESCNTTFNCDLSGKL